MTRTAFVLLLAMACSVTAKAADELPVTTFEIPSVGGWVMAPDLVTLIVSSPETGELYFVDTTTSAPPRTVKVPFKPDRLALQKDQLFVSVQGSTLVYSLNAKTSQEIRRYKLPGTAIRSMACHPEQGPVFASNADEEVVALDPKGTTARNTKARGTFLAVDPKLGRYLYTATNRPSEDVVEAKRGADGAVQLRFVTVAETAAVLKYEITSQDMKLVGGNSNAAVGAGGYLHVAPDGERYVMIAGGGWWSTKDKSVRYDIAVFETEDMTTMLGGLKCGAPQVICFHPVLDFGVAQGNSTDFYVFDARSLVHRGNRKVTAGGKVKFWHNLLAFGGKGTQVVTLQGNYLHLIPLELTAGEKATLTKRFGKLPVIKPVPAQVASATPATSTTSPTKEPTPAKAPTKPAANIPVEPRLVEINKAPALRLADAKPGIGYSIDREHALASLPANIEGGTLIARPARNAREWLKPGQLTALRDGKAFVAILTKFNGQDAASPQVLKTLQSEGWAIEKANFAARPNGSNEVWVWTVLSRKVSKGPVDVSSSVELQAPSQAIFLFK